MEVDMSKELLQPYKGARDFYPEDKRYQQWMFDTWKRVVERFGYLEYDAPILEPTDLYLIKGSEEIVNEQTYTFEDRGGRSVTVRTEMTPSVSRMVAGRRQELPYPIRWYSIPNLWRYERMQRGRLREFWQLNVDIFGVESVNAEIEMIQIIDALFQEFKAKRSAYTIRVNSRALVNAVLQAVGLEQKNQPDVIRLIDKMNKMSASEFAEKLDAITKNKDCSQKIVAFLGSSELTDLNEEFQLLESTKNIAKVIGRCRALGVSNVVFDASLMRGFDYYTDIVFEAFDNDPENNRSMFGGGRYDGLVEQFGVEAIPTVGFGMGDVTFQNFLSAHKLIPDISQSNEVRLLIRDSTSIDQIQKIASELRDEQVNVAIDFSEKKLDKQLKNAAKSDVRYVVFAGAEELISDQYTMKDMKTGKEEKHSLARIVSLVKDARKK
jgi:histidyl-tRNA synthetase